MSGSKVNKVKIGLILIVIAAVVLCVASLWSYQGNQGNQGSQGNNSTHQRMSSPNGSLPFPQQNGNQSWQKGNGFPRSGNLTPPQGGNGGQRGTHFSGRNGGFAQSGSSYATAALTAVIVILPFSFNQEPLWIVKLFTKTVGEYPYASVNAFNFFALLGANYKQDASTLFLFSYHTWGMIFIVLTTLFAWWVYAKGRGPQFASLAALILISGVFTFSTSMHERYLFPAASFSLLAYVQFQDKRLLWTFFGFSATLFVNTYAILYGSRMGWAPYDAELILTSLLNVLLVIDVVIQAVRLVRLPRQ